MANPPKETQFKPGQSGNPKGNALDRHSTKTISDWINQLLNDEEFTMKILDGVELKEYKGAPIKAIIGSQMRLALQHSEPTVRQKSADLLFKHGGVKKTEVDVTSNGETVAQPVDANMLTQFLMSVKDDTKR